MLSAMSRGRGPGYFLVLGLTALAASGFVFLQSAAAPGWQWYILAFAGVALTANGLMSLGKK